MSSQPSAKKEIYMAAKDEIATQMKFCRHQLSLSRTSIPSYLQEATIDSTNMDADMNIQWRQHSLSVSSELLQGYRSYKSFVTGCAKPLTLENHEEAVGKLIDLISSSPDALVSCFFSTLRDRHVLSRNDFLSQMSTSKHEVYKYIELNQRTLSETKSSFSDVFDSDAYLASVYDLLNRYEESKKHALFLEVHKEKGKESFAVLKVLYEKIKENGFEMDAILETLEDSQTKMKTKGWNISDEVTFIEELKAKIKSFKTMVKKSFFKALVDAKVPAIDDFDLNGKPGKSSGLQFPIKTIQPIPGKPVFFDIALNYVTYPEKNIERRIQGKERISTLEKDDGQGLLGFVSGFWRKWVPLLIGAEL